MKYLLSLFMLLSIVSVNAMENNLSRSESDSFVSAESSCEETKTFVTTAMASATEKVGEVVEAAKQNAEEAVTKVEGKCAKFGKSVKAKFASLRRKTPTFASIKSGIKAGAKNVVAKIKNNPKKSAAIVAATVATVAAVVVCVKKYKAKKAKVA